ncbi:MAG: putative HTH-type transcriptional regulator YwaE [Actinomycetota bacterium]|jgi:DNA-binding MarR family transcriptional regulator|nr:MAG: putative HTH-type transcriptional regulator YwaE [Actinomycetota bacterium]
MKARARGADELLPAERRVLEVLGHLPLDLRAMGAISNLFRCSTAIRRHMEARVLAEHRLSWTSFVGLWVLWVWGEMEAHRFAAAVGISRPTASGVMKTLESRGLLRRRRATQDGRMVLVRLTPKGRRTIEQLFPRFNREEAALASRLAPADQDRLAAMLRTLLRAVDGTEAALA